MVGWIIIHLVFAGCEAIRCYQCSSDTDPKNQDLCGAYNKFDTQKNIPIECGDMDSTSPGTFCLKVVKQSPRGFICKYLLTALRIIFKYCLFLCRNFWSGGDFT